MMEHEIHDEGTEINSLQDDAALSTEQTMSHWDERTWGTNILK